MQRSHLCVSGDHKHLVTGLPARMLGQLGSGCHPGPRPGNVWLLGTAGTTSPRNHLAAGTGATHGEPYPIDVPAPDLVVPREMVACDSHTAPCHPLSPVPITPGRLPAPPAFFVPHPGGHTLPERGAGSPVPRLSRGREGFVQAGWRWHSGNVEDRAELLNPLPTRCQAWSTPWRPTCEQPPAVPDPPAPLTVHRQDTGDGVTRPFPPWLAGEEEEAGGGGSSETHRWLRPRSSSHPCPAAIGGAGGAPPSPAARDTGCKGPEGHPGPLPGHLGPLPEHL